MFTRWFVAALGLIGGAVVSDGRPTEGVEERQALRVRREWSDLSPSERIAYTDAIACLMRTPSALPELYQSTNMFDDFLAVHINHTWQIHLNGIFLPYHRGLLKAVENALHTKCGYQGMQPYCHWPKYLNRPLRESTIFDGSRSSFGSDGASSNTAVDQLQGGSCVARGPFSNHRVPYRSLSLAAAESGQPPDQSAWTRGDDCLRRRLNDGLARRISNQNIIDQAIAAPNIDEFRRIMDPTALGGSGLGFHSGTHSMLGGHLGDLFVAAADPVFYCLHAELDRIWLRWQNRDPQNRKFGPGALSGTLTFMDLPRSRRASMDTVVNFGNVTPLGRDRALREMMDPSASWLGYTYT